MATMPPPTVTRGLFRFWERTLHEKQTQSPSPKIKRKARVHDLVPGGPDIQINTDNGGGNGVAGAQHSRRFRC